MKGDLKMIPSKSKALLVTNGCNDAASLMLSWAGLGAALVFLILATVHGV